MYNNMGDLFLLHMCPIRVIWKTYEKEEASLYVSFKPNYNYIMWLKLMLNPCRKGKFYY